MNMLLEFTVSDFIYASLSFLLPAALVFVICYFLINRFLENQKNQLLLEIKREQSNVITPIKLQAYERLTIFLDRISPDNLVLRHSKTGQSAAELRSLLIGSITEEFNHNVSQQIFISNQAWSVIKAVKEQIIGIVDQCFTECTANSTGPELGKKVLMKLMERKEIPTQQAIAFLKKEIEVMI